MAFHFCLFRLPLLKYELYFNQKISFFHVHELFIDGFEKHFYQKNKADNSINGEQTRQNAVKITNEQAGFVVTHKQKKKYKRFAQCERAWCAMAMAMVWYGGSIIFNSKTVSIDGNEFDVLTFVLVTHYPNRNKRRRQFFAELNNSFNHIA